MGFIKFMVSNTGRVTRIVAGVILITAGLLWLQGTGGIILAVVGAVPLVAGLFDLCLFAPLFGLPFMGSHVRRV